MRVKITLLEYGDKGIDISSGSKLTGTTKGTTEPTSVDENRQMTATNEVAYTFHLILMI